MNRTDKEVLKAYNKVCRNQNEKKTLDIETTRENGINSLSIVSLILDIEDVFEINLDDSLKEIRSAKTLQEIADIVNRVVTSKKLE